MTDTDLLDTREAAKALGVTRRTITLWARHGQLAYAKKPDTKTGGYTFTRAAVEAKKAERDGERAA